MRTTDPKKAPTTKNKSEGEINIDDLDPFARRPLIPRDQLSKAMGNQGKSEAHQPGGGSRGDDDPGPGEASEKSTERPQATTSGEMKGVFEAPKDKGTIPDDDASRGRGDEKGDINEETVWIGEAEQARIETEINRFYTD